MDFEKSISVKKQSLEELLDISFDNALEESILDAFKVINIEL